jgi:hypothetical protein
MIAPNSLVVSVLEFFKSKAIDGCVPNTITGRDIYLHFNFRNKDEENSFFNTLCYDEVPSILQINPGQAIMSENWIDNIYGLREPYLTQLGREVKIDKVLGIKSKK